ncbi:hypothetical protein K492DRAFT_240374 [Lichtheimia hyalospora FSU 10163]|nr:hypothetical protein K492DRAFT_240374 [Lichtheimia hyalospora FSU 10163]
MTDKFCNALLRTTALQILQSAGFDSAHVDPTNILTDVLSQYLQLLASTSMAYAQLAGRGTSNAWDVVDGLDELGLTVNGLRDWLEEEGKALAPSWSAQSDPGRTLDAVVKNGRNQHQDVLVYEYTDDEERLYDSSEEEEEQEESIASPIPVNNDLPEYVPSYFPSFPTTINKQDEQQPTTGPTLPLATPPPPPTSSQQQPISTSGAPAPIIVRSRKRAIDNPFTHVVPFEESALAASAAEGGGGALSLTLDEENERQTTTMNQGRDGEKKRRRTALSTIPMKNAVGSLTNKENPLLKRKARDELIGNHAMFRRMTQNEAAPGNTMFSSPTGVLAELLHRVAPPTLVSKLSAPNLLVDVASTTTTSQPATSTQPSSQQSQPSSSNGKDQPSRSTSGSMLASLAGGQYNRKQSSLEDLGSPPVTTSATTTTSMTTTTAATMAIPTTTTTTTTPTPTTTATTISTSINSNTSTLTPISLASLSAGHEPQQPSTTTNTTTSSSSSTKKKLPKLTLNLSNNDPPATTTPSTAESTPTSLNTPKIRFKIKPPEDTSAPSTPNAQSSSPPQARPSSSSSSTPAYESETIQITDPITTTTSADIVPPDASGEIVHCICENPTVDYGTFMIACDKCGVWYHGTCVGVAEIDQVEEWYCRNCA